VIPVRRPGQSFDNYQAEVARWLGCDVFTMNATHDAIHASMCKWLGITSHALREARGERLSVAEADLAETEEFAALAVQRLIIQAGIGVPQ